MEKQPHYEALCAASRTVGWPKSFRRDLTFHDKRACSARDVREPFMWILRESGTHMYGIGFRDGAGHRAEHMPQIVAGVFSGEMCRFYFWDGWTLREFPTAEALADRVREEIARVAPTDGAL